MAIIVDGLAPVRSDAPVGTVAKPTPEVDVPRPTPHHLTVALPAAVAFVAAGMAFLFAWEPLVHHVSAYAVGGDLWGIYRGAHYIGWGLLGGVYNPGNGVVAFPGMELVLAPVAMLTGHFHMTEAYGPFNVPHPTAALVLVPVELVLGSSVLFAVNSAATTLGVGIGRRRWLVWLVAPMAWLVVAAWGHGEDLVAVTFLLYALDAAHQGRWTRMGWLLSLGILFQPLAATVAPVLLAMTPSGMRVRTLLRMVALPAAFVAIAFGGDAHDAFHQLVEQPTPPTVNHATPWVNLSPTVPPTTPIVGHVGGAGRGRLTGLINLGGNIREVSGGAGRMLYVVLALVTGLAVWRRPALSLHLYWLAGAILAGRCFFEPVMTPYYLTPPLIVLLVVASTRPARVFAAATILAGEISWFAYFHLNEWVWWIVVVAGLAAVVALAFPWRARGERRRGAETSLSVDVTGVPGDAAGDTEPAGTGVPLPA